MPKNVQSFLPTLMPFLITFLDSVWGSRDVSRRRDSANCGRRRQGATHFLQWQCRCLVWLSRNFIWALFSRKHVVRPSTNYHELIAEEAFYGLLGPKPSWLSAFLHKLHIKHLAWQWQATPKSSIKLECLDSLLREFQIISSTSIYSHTSHQYSLQVIFSLAPFSHLFPSFVLVIRWWKTGGANSQGSHVELGLGALGWASWQRCRCSDLLLRCGRSHGGRHPQWFRWRR